MAQGISGSFGVNAPTGRTYQWVTYSETYDEVLAQSVVTATAYIRRYSSSSLCTMAGNITIDGQVFPFSRYGTISTSDVELCTVSTIGHPIEHNPDGKKQITISAYWNNTGTSLAGDYYGEKSVSLTEIARQSNLSPISDFDVDMGFIFNADKPSPTSYRKLVTRYGSTVLGYIYEEGLVNGSQHLLSSNISTIYELMRNVNELTYTFDLYTYTDSTMTTQIGNVSTVNAKGTIYGTTPTTATFTYRDTNTTTVALTGNPLVCISGYSNVEITILSANRSMAQKGASIVYYSFPNGDNVDYTTSDLVHLMNGYNVENIIIWVYDSRGNYNGFGLQNRTVSYSLPNISFLETLRNDGFGNEVYLGLNASLWNGEYASGRANTIKYFGYRVKENTSDIWSNWFDATSTFLTKTSGQALNNLWINSDDGLQIYSDGTSAGFTTGVQYDIQVMISDGYSTTTFNSAYGSTTVDDGKFLDSYYKSTTGYKYAINDFVDTTLDDGLQVNGKLYVNKTSIFEIMYPMYSLYISTVNANPYDLFGFGSWERINGYYLYAGTGGNVAGSNTSGGSSISSTGGTAITEAQMPPHNHGETEADNAVPRRTWVGGTPDTFMLATNGTTSWSSYPIGRLINKGSGQAHSHSMSHTHGVTPLRYEVYAWKRIG